MGYIVEAKLLKFRETYLFQRKCLLCGEKYLFDISEAKWKGVLICESCSPKAFRGLVKGEGFVFVEKGYGVKITGWENRLAIPYEVARKSTKNFKKVLQRDEMICQYCYDFGDSVDHIVPVCCGGGNDMLNLVCACRTCTEIAGGLIFDDYYNKKSYIYGKRKRK
mgnify:FL=1